MAITPVTYLAYVPGISGTGAGQFMQERHRIARDGVGSIVGWDGAAAEAGGDGWHAWKEDPVAAGTETVLNIGTFFIPVGGAVAGGGKVLSTAGRAGRVGKAARGGKHVNGNAADFVMPAGANITKGSTGVFSKGLETSRGRTDILEDVELDSSTAPARTGDGAAPDHDMDSGSPSGSTDGSRAAEPPRGRSETEPEGTGDSRDSPTPGRRADSHAAESRDDASFGGTEPTQGDGEGRRANADESRSDGPESSAQRTDAGSPQPEADPAAPPVTSGNGSGARPSAGTHTSASHPGSYDPDAPVRETIPAKGSGHRYNPADVQQALDEAPQNKWGDPVDHRNGRPLLLENVNGDRGWVMRRDPDSGVWVAENRGLT
ncbi:hypothetical protein GCM10009625_24960 [Brachybacterium fresconis]